jgi:hypothetical protein
MIQGFSWGGDVAGHDWQPLLDQVHDATFDDAPRPLG